MSKQKLQAIIVPHTHWDREWRYPIWENRVLLMDFFDELMELVEKDEAYGCFVLDGQCVPVEDYLETRPDKEEAVRQLVQKNHLRIGPWYSLPDLYPVDGECLLRNLLRGTRLSKKFGGHLGIGYNSFGWGQISQFPQIYKGFGFDYLIAAKRVSKTRAPHCEFLWEGPDGTQIFTNRLGANARANGFGNVYIPARSGVEIMDAPGFEWRWGETGIAWHEANSKLMDTDYFRLDKDQRYHKERLVPGMENAWKAMDETLTPDFRLIMWGCDFTSSVPLLSTLIRDANGAIDDKEFVWGTLEEFAEEQRRLIKDEDLPVVKGEMRDGPAFATSGNALATRIHVKQKNKSAENMLMRRAEPLLSALAMRGAEYPDTLLDIAWKNILQSQAHDSINGVTQDQTVEDVINRLSQAGEIGRVLFNRATQQVALAADLSGFDSKDVLLLLYNPLPYPVSDVLKVSVDLPPEEAIWTFGLVDAATDQPLTVQHLSRRERNCPVHDPECRPYPFYHDRHVAEIETGEIPAGGYKVCKVTAKEKFGRRNEWWPTPRTSQGEEIARTPECLENAFLRVQINSDGTINLHDKEQGRDFNNIHYFEDSGDVGDYWAHYPPYENSVLLSKGSPARVQLLENGPLRATVSVEVRMEVPARALMEQKPITGDNRRIMEDTRTLRIISEFTLKKDSPRLEVHTTVENTAEDHRLRLMLPTDIEAEATDAAGHFTVEHRPHIPQRDALDGAFWPEMQTLPMGLFADVSDGKQGLAILSNGLTEHQLCDDPRRTLAVTLFRAVRNRICTELLNTSSYPEQKGGQLLQTLEFDYAVYPHKGNYEEGRLYKEALAFCNGPGAYQVSRHEQGRLPLSHSFMQLTPDTLVLSCLKKAEDRESWILRLYNPSSEAKEGRFLAPAPIAQAWKTNLNEEREEELTSHNGKEISFSARPQQILTIEFTVKKEN